ncbi:unnamed protein product [Closterium sp. Yama58-4]|nr:unnamed protein product [Closterium sp. Yama58-4]
MAFHQPRLRLRSMANVKFLVLVVVFAAHMVLSEPVTGKSWLIPSSTDSSSASDLRSTEARPWLRVFSSWMPWREFASQSHRRREMQCQQELDDLRRWFQRTHQELRKGPGSQADPAGSEPRRILPVASSLHQIEESDNWDEEGEDEREESRNSYEAAEEMDGERKRFHVSDDSELVLNHGHAPGLLARRRLAAKVYTRAMLADCIPCVSIGRKGVFIQGSLDENGEEESQLQGAEYEGRSPPVKNSELELEGSRKPLQESAPCCDSLVLKLRVQTADLERLMGQIAEKQAESKRVSREKYVLNKKLSRADINWEEAFLSNQTMHEAQMTVERCNGHGIVAQQGTLVWKTWYCGRAGHAGVEEQGMLVWKVREEGSLCVHKCGCACGGGGGAFMHVVAMQQTWYCGRAGHAGVEVPHPPPPLLADSAPPSHITCFPIPCSPPSSTPQGYTCDASEEALRQYSAYDASGACPDDWFATQSLIFHHRCFSLPQRRCRARTTNQTINCGTTTPAPPSPHPPVCLSPFPLPPSTPLSSSPLLPSSILHPSCHQPLPFPQALFNLSALFNLIGTAASSILVWDHHACSSFACLNARVCGTTTPAPPSPASTPASWGTAASALASLFPSLLPHPFRHSPPLSPATLPPATPSASLLPSISLHQPLPFPQALFNLSALIDGALIWDHHACSSFACLNARVVGDCRLCFNLTLERNRWRVRYRGSLTIEDVLKMKKGSIRIGLDIGGGTGSFAAHMALYNVTILTTAMNVETVVGRKQGLPYMEAIALRGLIPLHLPHKARLPFFDGSLDLIHSVNSVKYLPMLEFEEMLFEWDRVLRVGGVIWLEMFYAPLDEFPVYVAILNLLSYNRLHWPRKDLPDKVAQSELRVKEAEAKLVKLKYFAPKVEEMRDAAFCDVTLRPREGEAIKAHRCILATWSPVFAKMFSSGLQEETKSSVHIQDTGGPTLEKLISFMYSGDLPMKSATMPKIKLLVAADKYQVLELKEHLCLCLCGSLDNDIVFEAFKVADMHDAPSVRQACADYILKKMDRKASSPIIMEMLPGEDPQSKRLAAELLERGWLNT